MKICRTALALVLMSAMPATAATVQILSADVTIQSGDTGVLLVDLACVPARVGITLEHRARLDLNGHVLDGCSVGASVGDPRAIKLFGPGVIRNAGILLGPGRLVIRDIAIEDAPLISINGGIDAGDPRSIVKATNVTSTGAALVHILASKVRVRNVAVSGATTSGIEAGKLGGHELDASGNGVYGVFASGGRAALSDATLDANGCAGIAAQRLRLKGGQAVGNDTLGDGCPDLYSGYKPQVSDFVCGTSSDTNEPPSSWSVCAGD